MCHAAWQIAENPHLGSKHTHIHSLKKSMLTCTPPGESWGRYHFSIFIVGWLCSHSLAMLLNQLSFQVFLSSTNQTTLSLSSYHLVICLSFYFVPLLIMLPAQSFSMSGMLHNAFHLLLVSESRDEWASRARKQSYTDRHKKLFINCAMTNVLINKEEKTRIIY